MKLEARFTGELGVLRHPERLRLDVVFAATRLGDRCTNFPISVE